MKKIFSTALVLALTSCASVMDGSTQKIPVNTTPQGAECSLSNDSGTKKLVTPGMVEISRSKSDLMVECAINGYGAARKLVKSEINDWAWGNLVGGVGIIWDGASGASWKYADKIDLTIPQTQTNGAGSTFTQMPVVGVPQIEAVHQEIPVEYRMPPQQQQAPYGQPYQQAPQQNWQRNTLQPPSRM